MRAPAANGSRTVTHAAGVHDNVYPSASFLFQPGQVFGRPQFALDLLDCGCEIAVLKSDVSAECDTDESTQGLPQLRILKSVIQGG